MSQTQPIEYTDKYYMLDDLTKVEMSDVTEELTDAYGTLLDHSNLLYMLLEDCSSNPSMQFSTCRIYDIDVSGNIYRFVGKFALHTRFFHIFRIYRTEV